MSQREINKKIQWTASVLGVLLASSGVINHGIFEILQGNTATGGLFIEAIGIHHRFWVHGTEGAFTLIPNFLLTGVATVFIGLFAMIWSAKFLDTKHGVKIFFLSFVLMALFGGGIGFLFIFLPTWIYSTRLKTGLVWWRRRMSTKMMVLFARIWPFGLTLTCVMWLIIMELGIFGCFPGIVDPDTILNLVMFLLLGTIVLVNITFVGAIAADILKKT